MDIKEIDYILAIADSGSLLRAAEKLFVTQSALSKYISKLESRLGFQLFHREKKNRLVFTEGGKIYLQHARKIAAERDAMEREIAQFMQEGDCLHIGVRLNTRHLHLAEILREFHLHYPKCEVNIHSQYAAENQADVKAGVLDFVHTNAFENEPELVSHPIYKNLILLAIPSDHPLAAEILIHPKTGIPWVNLSKFKNEDFILQNEHCALRKPLDDMLLHANFNLNVLALANNSSTALTFVNKGIGMCFCPLDFIDENMNIRYASFGNPPYSIQTVLAYRKDKQLTPSVKDFMALFEKYNSDFPWPSHCHTASLSDGN